MFSTRELAEEVGEAYAKDADGDFYGPRSYSAHEVKLDIGASVRGLGDWVFQPALRVALAAALGSRRRVGAAAA